MSTRWLLKWSPTRFCTVKHDRRLFWLHLYIDQILINSMNHTLPCLRPHLFRWRRQQDRRQKPFLYRQSYGFIRRLSSIWEFETPLHKWATCQGCFATQKTAIYSAVLAAQVYATWGAYSNIKNFKGTSLWYPKRFGSYDLTRYNAVVSL